MGTRDFKLRAKDNLRGQWPLLVVITLLVLFVTGAGANNLRFESEQGTNVSLNLITFLLNGPINLGMALLYLGLEQTKTARLESFLEGFRSFLDAFLLNLLTMAFVILWSLLLVVPGIIAAIRYSMAYLIMAEDPGMTPRKALDASKALMAGHKAEYALFVLSFIGWGILTIITFGLASLYLIPYFNASKVNFYHAIKGEPSHRA
ncbi:MAG: hypothetical protein AVO33_00710 [delta proteobacterium ML8_F1]|nr:MAG: hypothetical protein AVO33_00710 [delta proteobacterium ML8_F1]